MEQGGMVHALEEIHRLLRPDGSLIDIHPSLEAPLVEIHQDEKTVFAEPVPEHAYQGKQQAEKALTDVVQRGLFMVQRAGVFDFRVYASSIVELRSFLEEANAFEDSPPDEEAEAWQAELAAQVVEAMQAAGEGAEVAFYERVRITRLRPFARLKQIPSESHPCQIG
jgi:hypothetical protein